MLKTILFDMGNVLVYFCHERMCRQIGKLYGQSEEEIRTFLIDSGLQVEFEKGTIQPEGLWFEFQQKFGKELEREITLEELALASSDIFWLNELMPPLLEELKSAGIRLVLLSNTSVSHFDFIMENFSVLQQFDDFVTSYEVGAMKPETAIYEAALQKIECQPEECFYTDDIQAYIETAKQHGLHAEVFQDVPQLREHLRNLGVPV